MRGIVKAVLSAAVGLCTVSAPADVLIDTVTIGNPGNAGELSGSGAGGYGVDRICGAVDYVYHMGTFEITAGQYVAFLNAVASTDTYGLYNTAMWSDPRGCKIQRSNTPRGYTYSVAADWADRPVNYVSWGDAARFANWLHHGQPSGAQGLGTTEDGSYFLNGAVEHEALLAVTRELDATWVIPSEDEWYKAAYHKNDGVTGNYWDYPTGTDDTPSNLLLDPDLGNNANFAAESGYTIGSPYYRTEAGDFENSASPYGTFDQGGNLFEWTEAVIGDYHLVRGGSWGSTALDLRAAQRYSYYIPPGEFPDFGFRMAQVPEPGALGLLAFGLLGVLAPRRR